MRKQSPYLVLRKFASIANLSRSDHEDWCEMLEQLFCEFLLDCGLLTEAVEGCDSCCCHIRRGTRFYCFNHMMEKYGVKKEELNKKGR